MHIRTKGKTAQDIQDEIFRRMSAGDKLKLGSDFSMYGLKAGLKDGAPIPMWYLKQWLEKNQKPPLLRLLASSNLV